MDVLFPWRRQQPQQDDQQQHSSFNINASSRSFTQSQNYGVSQSQNYGADASFNNGGGGAGSSVRYSSFVGDTNGQSSRGGSGSGGGHTGRQGRRRGDEPNHYPNNDDSGGMPTFRAPIGGVDDSQRSLALTENSDGNYEDSMPLPQSQRHHGQQQQHHHQGQSFTSNVSHNLMNFEEEGDEEYYEEDEEYYDQQQQQQRQQFPQDNANNIPLQDELPQDEYLEEEEVEEEEEEEDLPPSPLRQLLDAINMSILPTSLRLSSLSQAVEFFDHRDRAMHDAELREGAAFVLYHKLGLVLRLSKSCEMERLHEMNGSLNSSGGMMGGAGGGGMMGGMMSSSRKPGGMGNNPYLMSHYNSSQQQSEHDKEIAMICSCLEMVHRSNPDGIAQTWDECGREILPLLVSVLERPFNKIEQAVWTAINEKANVPGSLERAVAMAVTRDQKLAVQKVTKVLAMYSLVPEGKRPMCQCEGMLRCLTRIIDTHNYNRVKPGAPVIGGTASTSLPGPLDAANATTNPNGLENENAKHAARLALATRATSGSGLYMTEAARFNTIATLTNLAALEANRMPMLSEPGLMDNVCRAVHNERSDVPKQCSALAIMNLSNGDPDHVPEMASNDLVLETLLKLMREDNPETRRNAVVTIFNIACSDQNTVRLARYRDGTILEALTELVGSDDPVRIHDEARSNAAETIFNMSCSEISETTDRMANHAGLLECLAVTLRGEHTGLEVKMFCSATLRRMAELIRHPMIAQGALLSALVKAATWTSTDCIAEAFRAQALVTDNCVIMANHHGLLNALSRLALTRGEGADVEKVRMAAVGAIELMSRQDDARALLAHNEGIMMALTRASYGEEVARASMRRSVMSEADGSFRSQGSFMQEGDDGSDGEDRDSDDESSAMQSRRIQVALKNLVSAM